MSALSAVLAALVIGYLPGAILFRWPFAARATRAALAAEERVFWQVVTSVAWSLALTLAMAAAGVYRLERLLAVNAAVSAAGLAIARGRLRWHGTQAPVTVAILVPLTLLGLGVWRFAPAAEYVMGGKDPGVYINEGFAIARTGQLFRRDPVVAAVPEASRDLFFPSHHSNMYYGLRFMGVFINDPSTGEVISGFPHLFPASVAIGDALAGAAGATHVVGVWAVLGLLAVYFFGSRLIGRLPAAFAVGALALNVIEVWYGRYPNAEVVMQALLFAALLALARGHQDDDRFFGWVGGALIGLLLFLRLDMILAVGLIGAGLALRWIVEAKAPRPGALLTLAAGGLLALAYYRGPMWWYAWQYQVNLPSLGAATAVAAGGVALAIALGSVRRHFAAWALRLVPLALGAAIVALAAYALFLREPGGRLTDYDAYALRTYREAYVFWPALAAAVAGYALTARRAFWRDPVFFLVVAAYAVFFFYKIRVVPEQFWMARRFLPVILPGTLLFASAAVFGPSTPEHRRTVRRAAAAILFMGAIGWQYVRAAAPVAAHVEYKGAIRQVDRLAGLFTPRDLILVESRNAGSDFHVLALPLAYEHGLQVLVLDSPKPDRRRLEAFLAGALGRYDRVLFIGGGGTDLLSRRIGATPVAFTPLMVPEFETTTWNERPAVAREKDLGYSVFQLTLDAAARTGFSLDVGYLDDLNVVRFFAREVSEGRTFRWTGRQSFIAATGLTGGERELELVLHDGGRPAAAPPATVEVFFNETPLGSIRVGSGFQTYRLALPAEAARLAAQSDDPAQIRLVSSVWSPRDVIAGSGDTRNLGVMLDRVAIH